MLVKLLYKLFKIKHIVFIDMDCVLADFYGSIPGRDRTQNPPLMYEPGFFRNLTLMPGAKATMEKLRNAPHLSLYIASKPIAGNSISAKEKYEWIHEYFPFLLDKIFLTCDKGLLRGWLASLIDDDIRWKKKYRGRFLHFDDLQSIKSWKTIERKLL